MDEEDPNRRIGGVHFGGEFRALSRGQVIVRGIVAPLLFSAVVAGIFAIGTPPGGSLLGSMLTTLGFIAYCVIASLVHPQPNHADSVVVGNPTRITDNVNRLLLNFTLWLLPGKFIGTSVIDLVMLIRTGKLPQERALEKLES